MAHNALTGTVIAPAYFGPGIDAGTNILSGNLSTSDGANIINIPRVSNATDNGLVTNVGGDANALNCETNLTFDGDTLGIVGGMSASAPVSASFFYGDGSQLTGVNTTFSRTATNATITASTSTYYIGVDSTANVVSIRLPSASLLSDGKTYVVKDEGGNANNNNITILASGTETIDGQNSIVLESPHASIQLYCNGSNKYFIC